MCLSVSQSFSVSQCLLVSLSVSQCVSVSLSISSGALVFTFEYVSANFVLKNCFSALMPRGATW